MIPHRTVTALFFVTALTPLAVVACANDAYEPSVQSPTAATIEGKSTPNANGQAAKGSHDTPAPKAATGGERGMAPAAMRGGNQGASDEGVPLNLPPRELGQQAPPAPRNTGDPPPEPVRER